MKKKLNFLTILLLLSSLLSCKGPDGNFKLPGGDARKTPADPKKRIEQNLSEGRGFKLSEMGGKGGVFEFASSNELWRASLDVIDFMPLASVNYSGGIIVTDWYTENNSPNESIKISIRFLTNEIRSDALEVKIFKRKCSTSYLNCQFSELGGDLKNEVQREILKKAASYKKQKSKDYKYPQMEDLTKN